MSTFRKFRNHGRRDREQGYILLMMMLFITLLAIFGASLAHNMAFELKRDQEEEMIHRGVQYSRAVRKFVKKVGRYPTSLEDLENTNNIRFLRKRYKDPLTGKDFKLLHLGEVQLGNNTTALAGATSAAALAAGASGANGQNLQGLIAAQGVAGLAAQGQQPPQNLNGDQDPDAANNNQAGGNQQSGQFNQTFGGGPIVGVTSFSKKKTIREFNKKNHYNQWQFIYDPSSDRGGLITTPAQPPLQVAAPNVNGQPGQNGVNGNNSFGGFNNGNNGNFGGNQLGPGGLPITPQQPPPSQNPPQ
jgi:type II secretory pathway pseudopilin PulG